jgi:ferredoxin
MAAVVDKDKCDGCGDCVEACPVNAIQLQNGKAVICDDCIDCNICVKTCPNQAISLRVKRPMYDRTLYRGDYGTGGKDNLNMKMRITAF